jgi:hypothetical protein
VTVNQLFYDDEISRNHISEALVSLNYFASKSHLPDFCGLGQIGFLKVIGLQASVSDFE